MDTTDFKGAIAPAVLIGATLDRKSEEIAFLRDELMRRGVKVLLIDCGVLGETALVADISRAEVAAAAGTSIEALRASADREQAIPAMIRGLEAIVTRLLAQGRVAGYLGVGGGTNAALAAAAFRQMPHGMPKLLLSTVVSGSTRSFVGGKDVLLLHSVVDVMGLNSILCELLVRAAHIMAALVQSPVQAAVTPHDSTIGVTAFGSTTAAAARAVRIFEAAGHEVLTFHARGVGGESMEGLIADGRIQAVLDLTTTEVADEIVGGALSAGPRRLEAAGRAGIPQVVLPGAIDMVNFGSRETVPPRFTGRRFLSHTPHATLMRTTPDENCRIAAFIAAKLNAATGPCEVIVPTQGFSAYDAPGGPFFDPEADAAFVETLRAQLRPDIPLHMIDAHINDVKLVDLATQRLLALIGHAQAFRGAKK